MRWFALLAPLLLSIGTAGAQTSGNAAPLSGLWVPGDLLQALQAEAPRQIPCYLVIEASPELEIFEECGHARSRWTGPVLEAERAGRLEVHAGEQRRLVFRAGAPNELELVRTRGPDETELVRLYRLPAGLEERLRSWAAAQRLLVGSWRTEDGVEVEFTPEGSYRIAQEQGRYRLLPGAVVPGSWGVIRLQPAEGQERIYLITGSGRRLGLALPPAHLVPMLRGELEGEEAGLPPPGGGQERGMRPGEEMPAAGKAEERPPAAEQQEGAEMGAGQAPGSELEVAIWLSRTGTGVEQQATAPAAPRPEPEPEDQQVAEPAPITQPIQPKGRCGCGAAEGATGLGLIAAGGLALRRRRQHDGLSSGER